MIDHNTKEKDDNYQKQFNPFTPIFYSIVLSVGVAIGYFLTQKNSSSTLTDGYHGKSSKINNLLDYIQMQYVDTVNKTLLENQTIQTMLKSLDPHSDFIPASDFTAVNEPLEGNFDGIGVEFNIINDTVRVVNPIIGGPSEKLGIKAGDKIIKVNGKSIAGVKITNKDVFANLRGKSGSIVTVSILRLTSKKELEFKITRGKIPIYSIDVAYILSPSIGYIKLSRFASSTYEEYLQAFNDLHKKGMNKLILDLRGNGGGFLNTAVDLADEFLSDGLAIVYTEGRAHPKKTYKASSKGGFENNKLVVLIDEGSASASEIVAGALQDNDRATIIGRRSFGKGLVQDQIDLPDGSAVRLTIARYYTPTGRCIQKPYDTGNDNYFNEEYERFEHGELYSADSIKVDSTKKYRTPNGKIVFGGGGIVPDIFVPIDTTKYNPLINRLFYNGILNTFAFEYTDLQRSQLIKEFGDATRFIKDYKVTSQVIIALNDYLKMKNARKFLLSGEEQGLKHILKALIGRNLFDKDAYYAILNQNDNAILKAVEVLQENQ